MLCRVIGNYYTIINLITQTNKKYLKKINKQDLLNKAIRFNIMVSWDELSSVVLNCSIEYNSYFYFFTIFCICLQLKFFVKRFYY